MELFQIDKKDKKDKKHESNQDDKPCYKPHYTPLADRIRPQNFHDICGQKHLLENSCPIYNIIKLKKPTSLILWGPAGCGKTTIAKLLLKYFENHSIEIRAMFSNVAEIKQYFQKAKILRQKNLPPMIIFIDEIHRFNKSQQDCFLPALENGEVIIIGATTENPSFELNNAILSRVTVLRLEKLNQQEIENILKRAEKFYNKKLPVSQESRKKILNLADGDGRYILTLAEKIFEFNKTKEKKQIELNDIEKIINKRLPNYDKNLDEHYNLISALHKAIRACDVQAALYYFARMIVAGEDRKYIARRLIRIAIEDIGLAQPQALSHAIAAMQAYQFLGSPEGELALVNSVILLANAPKSNAAYLAQKKSEQTARLYGSLQIPKKLVNPVNKMMKDMQYGKDYKYDHEYENAFSAQKVMPDEISDAVFYIPTDRGYETQIAKKMNLWQKQRQNHNKKSNA